MTLSQRRQRLLQLYRLALEAVSGEGAVRRFLQQHPQGRPCSLVAIGKAAAAMALGAQGVLGERLHRGLVITKTGHGEPCLGPRIRQLESAHPIPDASSLAAGEALLEFLATLPEGEPLLFLLSGGASSLVEVLPPGMDAAALAELNRWLLASGLGIAEMNAIRKRLSRIKGGRLLPYLQGRPCLQLLISDVPGDTLAVIGSGPLLPGDEALPETPALPEWLQRRLADAPPVRGEAGANIETHLIADNAMARAAVAAAATALGLAVVDHGGHFEGEAEPLAAQFCDTLLNEPAALHLWGGESRVTLPAAPGVGGRNQHLALLAARYLAGHDNVLMLVAGSDGSDGPTDDAGALVDGGTLQRGEWEGESAIDAVQRADAGRFLAASGDLVQTGPTGTNVMDLVFAWKW